jgi:tripartite-type tricarboxylate transporter receptor subunit TctC
MTLAATIPAQSWKPEHPIEILVGTSAGGTRPHAVRLAW